MFGPDNSDYMRFRAQVINLVLSTDIASPERTQLVKSKWKEAFGNETKHYFEQQRKTMMQQTKESGTFNGGIQVSPSSNAIHQNSVSSLSHRHSMPSSIKSMMMTSAASSSAVSDVSMDSVSIMQMQQQRATRASFLESLSSIQSEDDCTTPSSSERDVMDGVIQSGRTLTASSPTRNRPTVAKTMPTPPSTPPPPLDTTPRTGNRSPIRSRSPVVPRLDGQLSPVVSSRCDDESLSSVLSSKSPRSSVASPKKTRSPVARKKNFQDHRASQQLLHQSTDAIMSSSQRTYASAPVSSNNFQAPRMTRRFSYGDVTTPYRKSMRLGIRRSLDFTGQAIEPYCSVRTAWSSPAAVAAFAHSSSHGSAAASTGDESTLGSSMDDLDDEPDDLKATVVMEHLLRAADIGPNLQGWEHMKKWSGRLFYELKTSHEAGRCGFDPQEGWYENQITFLDAYVMPLAQKLQAMGVFGTSVQFDAIVLQNRERWTGEGEDATAETIQKWKIMEVHR
uniref:Uncharacterized protein n=1 Tax=Grammatophora oceanica TaxID=210454 RepID=A0A7S1UQ21_9STRA